tara:strand:- start:3551 stop:4714 length:1164 start_codon:yes stop_codon:yes gene_type:complete
MKLFKLYEQVEEEQKETQEPTLITLTPVDKKFLKLMQSKDLDWSDGAEIWRFLTDTLYIEDMELKMRLAYLYMEQLVDEDEGETYDDLEKVSLDMEKIMSNFDDKQLALSEFFDLPPFLIEEGGYSHYGLDQYENEDDGGTYAIGDEDEMDDAMDEYAQNRIDDGVEYMEDWYLEDHLEPNDSAIEQFAEEEADHRLSDMTDEEILEEAGYDNMDDAKEQWEEKDSEKDDIEERMNDLESEKEELESEQEDLDYEEDEDEYNRLEEEIDLKQEEINDLQSELDDLETEMEKLQEISQGEFVEQAKDELRENYTYNTVEEIRNEGFSYFVDNLGFDRESAIDSFFWLDEDSLKESIKDDEGYGALASYDGNYDEIYMNGVLYLIIRTD